MKTSNYFTNFQCTDDEHTPEEIAQLTEEYLKTKIYSSTRCEVYSTGDISYHLTLIYVDHLGNLKYATYNLSYQRMFNPYKHFSILCRKKALTTKKLELILSELELPNIISQKPTTLV